jgi:thioredoxin-related protein
MKTRFIIVTLATLLFLGAFVVSFNYKKDVKKAETTTEEIKWMSYDEATKLTKKKKKKIFIDVYTDWCGWCKKMDATTMKDPKVVAYMNKKFYAVKLNAESTAASNYKGTVLTERELATRIFKANGYPTTLYLDESENLLINLAGYREATELNKILHFLGEEKYKTQTWEQYAASYIED